MATPEPDQKRNPASTNRAPSEHAKLWRDADLNNLELLHAHFLTQSFAPHTHETYAIGFIEHGAETFDYRRQRHTAGAGTIAVIHPGEIHTGGPLGAHGWHYRALYPEPMLMTKLSAEIDCNHRDLPFFDQPVIYDVELFGELWRSHIALEDNATLLERESRLLWALARMIERYAHYLPALVSTAWLKYAQGFDTRQRTDDGSRFVLRLSSSVGNSLVYLGCRFCHRTAGDSCNRCVFSSCWLTGFC
jgi:hypothetical protein